MFLPYRMQAGMQSLGSPLLGAAGIARAAAVGCDGGVLRGWAVVLPVLGLLGLTLVAGLGLWIAFPVTDSGNLVRNFGFGAGVLAFSMAFVASLRPDWSPWLAPLYALASGVFMAGLARALELRFPGIALQSLLITLGVLAVMLGLYARRWLRATPRFRLAVYVATGVIATVYLLALLLSLAGWPLAWLGEASLGAALWHGFVAITAALNLVLDFERIEALGQRPQPGYMRWYVTLGLLVTMVWLYVSILRLLASLRR